MAFIWPWIAGFFVSLVLGQLTTASFLKNLRQWMGNPEKSPPPVSKEVPPWITGLLERLFFTIMVGFNVEGFPTAMMAWLALKMASNWKHQDMAGHPDARAFTLSALLAGIVSMLFALIGGLICAGQFKLLE